MFAGSSTGLGTAQIWAAYGDQIGAAMGQSVGTAGDVNGDGRSDVIVGVPYYDGGLEDEGSARVFHGTSLGLGTALSLGYGNWPLTNFGASVASAGDANGDGYSDIIIGGPSYLGGTGIAYVYHGSQTGFGSTASWFQEGEQEAVSKHGSSVASAGDVNGDGFSDVLVAAESHLSVGKVYLYLGSPAGVQTTPAWTSQGTLFDGKWGASVATAGDVNGDGFSDVIIGQYNSDMAAGSLAPWSAHVYRGSSVGLATSPAWSVSNSVPHSSPGLYQLQVATAGDVNGDGLSDVIIGMSGHNTAFVYHRSTGPDLVPAWEAYDVRASGIGCTVSTAGDVNGDGFSDVVVGCCGSGIKALAYHGSAGGLSLGAAWAIDNNTIPKSVATAGDLDGDGYSDVLLGEHTVGPGTNGRVGAYYGSVLGLQTTPRWEVQGNLGDELGAQVSTAGDGNGDGFSDVVLGAPGDRPYVNGLALVAFGNDGGGLDRIPQQLRTPTSMPISLLGYSNTSMFLRVLGRSPAGRDRVRLQVEVKPLGGAFDGTGLITGPPMDTGAPVGGSSAAPMTQLVNGLSQGMHRWRLRIVGDSPFFPRSIWLSHPGNAPLEGDFRVTTLTSAVEETPSPVRPHLAAAPNPFTSVTLFTFVVPREGRCRLSLYDVQGRHVSTMADGSRPSGRYSVRWDGRDRTGTDLAGGIYFLRLEAEGYVETRKIVIAR